jgi:replicative DNA helicase
MSEKNISYQKVPPQNIEAEMSVLGSMMLEKEACAMAIEFLNEGSFYYDAHQKIFSSIMSLFEKGRPVDLVTLTEELRRQKILKKVGGAAYLTSLLNYVYSSANIGHYIKIVRDKAILRNIINTATRIVADGYEDNQEVGTFLDRVESQIFSISQQAVHEDFIPVKDLIHPAIEFAEKLTKHETHITGVETGFPDLDEKTSGLQLSDLIIIAGRPSMGKSAFAINIAQHVAIVKKIPVAIFSLETSKEQIVLRMLCSEARVDGMQLRRGYLSASKFSDLTLAAGRLEEAPIFIDDSPSLSTIELCAKARRLKSKEDIGLIIIDYLQMMRSYAKSENRQQEMSEISRSIKALAKELKIPVIAVSQLSREVERRGKGARPQLSDLRESGALEQDADLVAFIHRSPEENKDLAELIIGKQRNGPIGTVRFTFIDKWTRFESYTERQE